MCTWVRACVCVCMCVHTCVCMCVCDTCVWWIPHARNFTSFYHGTCRPQPLYPLLLTFVVAVNKAQNPVPLRVRVRFLRPHNWGHTTPFWPIRPQVIRPRIMQRNIRHYLVTQLWPWMRMWFCRRIWWQWILHIKSRNRFHWLYETGHG